MVNKICSKETTEIERNSVGNNIQHHYIILIVEAVLLIVHVMISDRSAYINALICQSRAFLIFDLLTTIMMTIRTKRNKTPPMTPPTIAPMFSFSVKVKH